MIVRSDDGKPKFEIGNEGIVLRREFVRFAVETHYSIARLLDFVINWFGNEALSCYYQGKAVGETSNDHRKLLSRYMAHVIECESVSFVGIGTHVKGLSKEDVEELEKIEKAKTQFDKSEINNAENI